MYASDGDVANVHAQACRYRQFAQLVEQKRSWRTEIGDSCSIQEAIKKLAPPSARAATGNTTERPPRPRTQSTTVRKTTFADIVAAWMGAPNAERTRALDAIGWNALRGAIPQSWHDVLAAPVIDVTLAPSGGNPRRSFDSRLLNRKAK